MKSSAIPSLVEIRLTNEVIKKRLVNELIKKRLVNELWIIISRHLFS